MDNVFQLLAWDQEQLGIKCAKLIPENLTAAQIQQALTDLRQQNVKLVYWCAAATTANQQAAIENQGLLTDDKVTYLQALSNAPAAIPAPLEFYPCTDPDSSLLQLAYHVCDESRFAHDPNLTQTQAYKLYSTWLTNSTNHRNALDVLVIKDDRGYAAMVTLGDKNGRGDIGLLAVAEHTRGKGYGKILVNGALAYFKQEGFTHSQVVTQKTNAAACKLYESCGYKVEKLEYFYHFWL